MTTRPGPARRGVVASGLWVVFLAGLLAVAVVGVQVARIASSPTHAVGDGRDPQTYRFALNHALATGAEIVASGMPRDGLPALDEPPAWTLAELDRAAASRRGKLLVASDPVIGMRLGGQARAYPLRFLVWHEVVNDTLGGVGILVCHAPLAGASVVLARPAGVRFALSGLLLDSASLLYERAATVGGESLWSPLGMRAVTGPAAAAAATLEPLPCVVAPWRSWRDANPDTTVLAPNPRLAAEYRRDPYVSYLGNDELRFPAARAWPAARGPRKTPVVAVKVGPRWTVFPLPVVAARAGATGEWRTDASGVPLLLRTTPPSPTATAVAVAGQPLPTAYAFAFAWYALHPSDSDWVW